jgi:hypothetical protein
LFRRDVLTPQCDLRDGNGHVSSKPGRRSGIKIDSPETINLCYKGNCGSTVLRKVRLPGLRAHVLD